MEQNFILLNGGEDYDVDPFASADTYLVRLLGSEPAKRAVFYLRSMQDEHGLQRIAVFVGTRQVGYLPLETDPAVLTTIKACEVHGAVARARGSLTASWQQPGKVQVKVSLAKPEHLLANSTSPAAAEAAPVARPDSPADRQRMDLAAVANAPAASTATPMLSSSLEDAVALLDIPGLGHPVSPSSGDSDALQSATSAGLSAGWTEDYPDWPPPKPTPVVSQPDFATDPTKQGDGSISPEALLATRSSWVATPDQPPAQQAGWLGSKPSSSQDPGIDTPEEPPPPGSIRP